MCVHWSWSVDLVFICLFLMFWEGLNSKQAVSRERDRYGSTWNPFLYQTQGQTVCMTSKTAAVTSWSRAALICHLFTVFFKHYAEDTLLFQWFPRRPVFIWTNNPLYGYSTTFFQKNLRLLSVVIRSVYIGLIWNMFFVAFEQRFREKSPVVTQQIPFIKP